MKLDRNSIERRDFAAARRGYDPAEVDAHLARIADAVEQLKGSSGAAGTTADRVRAIVEAAERSAAEIEAGAREEAERSRARARAEAAESLRRAQEAEDLLAQAGAELERLRGALGTLRSTLEAPEDEVERPAPEPVAEPEQIIEPDEELGAEEPAEEAQETPAEVAHQAAAADDKGTGDGDSGARLIALNMALNGTPREETERYLEENFDLEDTAALLDDVYSA